MVGYFRGTDTVPLTEWKGSTARVEMGQSPDEWRSVGYFWGRVGVLDFLLKAG